MRNYRNERQWRMTKYSEVRAYIDKDLGLELRRKLKKENKTITGWVRENAQKYLEP